MSKPQWIFGTHHFELEAPDVLVARLRDWVTERDAQHLVALLHEICTHGPIYFVVCMEPMEGTPFPGFSPGGRGWLSGHCRPEWFKAILNVGGERPQSVVMEMFIRGLTWRGARTRSESAFFDDLNAARAWIEKHRGAGRAPACTR
jgi:hypothetical protein